MNVLRLSALAVALVGTAALADHHHHSSHHSSSGSSSLPEVCLKWAEVPVDGGLDAGAEVFGDEIDDPDDGGVEPAVSDAGASDAGTVATVRVCVEKGPALGCSSAGGGSAGAMLALMAVLLSRRRS